MQPFFEIPETHDLQELLSCESLRKLDSTETIISPAVNNLTGDEKYTKVKKKKIYKDNEKS